MGTIWGSTYINAKGKILEDLLQNHYLEYLVMDQIRIYTALCIYSALDISIADPALVD